VPAANHNHIEWCFFIHNFPAQANP
jgi:hypothetical protein